MQKIIMIKLGGSVITNKDIPLSLNKPVLSRLVQEVAAAVKALPDTRFIIGHGQGSFAHVPASKYKTKEGFINEESKYGMAVVLDSVAELNRIVVHEFLEADVPAVAVRPNNNITTANREHASSYFEVMEGYLQGGLMPVVCGDVLLDQDKGCTIWSTEEVLTFYSHQLQAKGWQVQNVIHVTDVEGVLDDQGRTIEKVSPQDWEKVGQYLGQAKGFDVTGGMVLKLKQSIDLADKGITSYILSGLTKGNLYSALTANGWRGTTISA